MNEARTRVLIAALLLLAGAGAGVSASIRADQWLILCGYIVGGAAAWHLYGTLVSYAQTKAKAALAARVSAGFVTGLKQWAAQQQANATKTPGPEPEGTQP